MKTFKVVIILILFIFGFGSCEKDSAEIPTQLEILDKTTYFDSEVFAECDRDIYGKWELIGVSGGLTGNGHDLNYDFLLIKEYGIYGFLRNDILLEYGKVSPALQLENQIGLQLNFEKDENSALFFGDPEKYVVFNGRDSLSLNSPCCDRYNYHFKRVK